MAKHACALCHKKDLAENMVYSRFTKARYCADLAACDRRVKRKTKKEV